MWLLDCESFIFVVGFQDFLFDPGGGVLFRADADKERLQPVMRRLIFRGLGSLRSPGTWPRPAPHVHAHHDDEGNAGQRACCLFRLPSPSGADEALGRFCT